MNTLFNGIVPKNVVGKAVDLKHSTISGSDEEAALIFKKATEKMLNINDWHQSGISFTATFDLTDSKGQKLNKLAALDDYIKIDVLGPGSSAGNGYDWVQIDAFEDNRDVEAPEESLAIRVRACKDPTGKTNDIAHFFSGEATSTFILQRSRNIVTSFYHGRNETLNTNTEKVVDKVRNIVIGGTALTGMSEIQWDMLIKSFLMAV